MFFSRYSINECPWSQDRVQFTLQWKNTPRKPCHTFAISLLLLSSTAVSIDNNADGCSRPQKQTRNLIPNYRSAPQGKNIGMAKKAINNLIIPNSRPAPPEKISRQKTNSDFQVLEFGSATNSTGSTFFNESGTSTNTTICHRLLPVISNLQPCQYRCRVHPPHSPFRRFW